MILASQIIISWPLNAVSENDYFRKEDDKKSIITFSLENDLFAGNDDNYTNGVRFAYLAAENNMPGWLDKAADSMPLFASEGKKRWHFDLGQSMYTPSNITEIQLQPNDRPYAGWLYSSVGVVSDTGYRLDNLQLSVGMVGTASLADNTQEIVHGIVGVPKPRGWNNQLRDEPGVILTYERKWRKLYEFSPFGVGADITPSIGGSAGNIFTHGAAGAVFRLGYDLPSDYGPPLIRPNLPGSDFFIPTENFGWYLFVGVEGRVVARNIFLDGNNFRDSHHVDKYPFVGGVQTGLALTMGNARIAYTQIFRSKEYKTQREKDEFGAITLSFRF